jgi:hypothetical protein
MLSLLERGGDVFMSRQRTEYVQARTRLLEEMTSTLEKDERFVAAWLTGSFGRGEQTWLSDLDIHVVVADAYSENLCATPWPSGAKTTPERFALFQQFGTPSIIFEDHQHNQFGGTFSHVVYLESAHNVDWMLIPQARAHQERASLLLFDKVGVPEPLEQEPESLEQRIERASRNVGFFWMLAAADARNLVEGAIIDFISHLPWLEANIREVKAALRGEPAAFSKHTEAQRYWTQEERVTALRHLCDEMEPLMPQVVAMGGYVPASPRMIVEKRLALLAET